MLTGEELDVQSYYAKRSATDERPDYDQVSIAIQPLSITNALSNAAGLAEPDAEDTPYALGRFASSKADAEGFCVAPALSEARLRLAAVPEHEVDMCTTAPAAPAYDVRYEFSNVRVYYTPSASGTQFAADLSYTQDGCVAKYRVAAVYPMVSCGVPTPLADAGSDAAASDAAVAQDDAGVEPDAGPGEECPPPEPPTGPPEPDDSLCAGAGINPDFAVVCDPDALMCALAGRPPSLK